MSLKLLKLHLIVLDIFILFVRFSLWKSLLLLELIFWILQLIKVPRIKLRFHIIISWRCPGGPSSFFLVWSSPMMEAAAIIFPSRTLLRPLLASTRDREIGLCSRSNLFWGFVIMGRSLFLKPVMLYCLIGFVVPHED